MRKMKKIKCELCNFEITTNQIKRHKVYCNGLGPKEKRIHLKTGLNWSKGKTFKEIYGEEKAKKICDKISQCLIGKSTGKGLTEENENLRKRRIAVSMKGNKNGATSFRRRKIQYKNYIFKSGWEVNVAKYFDENNIKWDYENITYSLSETSSYTPDFTLYEDDKIKHVEVKGYFRKENKEKYQKFLSMYPEIKVELWEKKILLAKNIKIYAPMV